MCSAHTQARAAPSRAPAVAAANEPAWRPAQPVRIAGRRRLPPARSASRAIAGRTARTAQGPLRATVKRCVPRGEACGAGASEFRLGWVAPVMNTTRSGEILVRRLCLTGVSSLSHLHVCCMIFSVSLRLSKRLSAVTVLSVSVAGASQMRLTFVSFGRVSLSLTAGLRRHSSEQNESSHFRLRQC